jgi:hypothetical protein
MDGIFQIAADVPAIGTRKQHVHQDKVWLFAGNFIINLLLLPGSAYLVSLFSQDYLEYGEHIRIVINYQYSFHTV